MSGGVDSAVAAARAVDAGHDVTGVHLALSRNPQSVPVRCARLLHARGRPRRPARRRRARHPVLRVGPGRAFAAGRRRRLRRRVRRRAAPRTRACAATSGSSSPRCSTAAGRSASTRSAPVTTRGSSTVRRGRELHRAVDPAKDQSYVLGVLDPRPAGRRDVPARRHGQDRRSGPRPPRRGLAVADKPDSHDICFIADGDTAASCAARSATAPGRVVDSHGEVLGAARRRVRLHGRAAQGLRLDRPAPDGRPRYVLDISPVTRPVTVGPRERRSRSPSSGRVRTRWCGPATGGPFACGVQLRAHGEELPGGGRGRPATASGWCWPSPRFGVAPGQSVVLYDGTRVVGSGHGGPHRVPLTSPAPRRGSLWAEGTATGVGSLPGTDVRAAVGTVLDAVPDLPFVPELPARGPGAEMIGRDARAAARHRCRVGAHRLDGRRPRRAVTCAARAAYLDEDLDVVEEMLEGWVGPLKAQVCGPWTLAATVELRNGRRALADPGAVRDLGQALAEAGGPARAPTWRGGSPGAHVLLQVDEPSLTAVLRGELPSPSGLTHDRGRRRARWSSTRSGPSPTRSPRSAPSRWCTVRRGAAGRAAASGPASAHCRWTRPC